MRVSPRARLGWLVLVAVLFASSPRGSAQPATEDQDLILEVRLHSTVLSDGLPVLVRGGRFLAPLGELSRALEFMIDVRPDSGRAAGWFLQEDRTFRLDLPQRSAQVGGQEVPFDADRIRLEPDDIYVDVGLLGVWFPVYLSIEVRGLLMRVEAREPLPVEQRLERERRRERALTNRRLLERSAYPRAAAPHGWTGWPSVDATTGYAYNRPDGDDGDPQSIASYSLLAASDLVRLEGQLFLAGDRDDTVREILLHAGRTDPAGELLGPLRATGFTLGDVYAPPSALIAESVKGRGFTLTSFPLDRPSAFDRTTLQGEGEPGWEVELYRNGALIGFQAVGDDGRYEFADIPVLYGLNLLRLVLYGPQGQRREEQRRYYVGPEQITPGQANYRIALHQHGADLIPAAGDLDDPDPRRGQARFLAEYERGLQRHLSAALSLASLPLREGANRVRHTYVGTDLRSSIGPVYTSVSTSTDMDGGWAALGAVQTRWQGLNWAGEYGHLHDYRSERIDDADLPTHRLRGAVDGGALLPAPIAIGLDVERTRRQSGRADTRVENHVALSLPRIVFSSTLQGWFYSGGTQEIADRITGELLLNTRVREVSVRGGLQYAARPLTQAQSVLLSLDRRWEALGRLSLDVNGSLARPRRITCAAGWNRVFRHFTLGIRGSYTDDGSYALGTVISISLSRDPTLGAWRVEGQAMAAQGVALARARLDRDGDGRFSEADEPISDLQFRVNRSRRRGAATNERGEALIAGLSAHRTADVTVDPETFGDPFWIVEPEGYSVLPRPGVATVMNFLVRETGAIEGTVFVRRGQQVREAPGVGVELVDGEGHVIKQATSASDGFYVFERVPYGPYTVRVAEKSALQLRLAASPQRTTLDTATPVRTEVQLILE